jgi:hypothetical protein
MIRKILLPVLLGVQAVVAQANIITDVHEVSVTIWMHGTRGTAFLPLGISQSALDTEYRMCFCPFGLNHTSTVDENLYHGTVGTTLHQADPVEFPLEHSYAFGWSGDANPLERAAWGKELYETLVRLKEKYANRGLKARITLITHSHGGNVALNIARYADELNDEDFIYRLILLGCPIQNETMHFATSPVFTQVYSFFSSFDMMQVIDPQKLYPLRFAIGEAWRSRSFAPIKAAFSVSRQIPLFSKRHLPIHEKIHQAHVSWSTQPPWQDEDYQAFGKHENAIRKLLKPFIRSRGALHIEFMLPLFLKRLPEVIKLTHELYEQQIQSSPHQERPLFVQATLS